MREKRLNRFFIDTAVMAALAFAAAGCDRYTRHKVLTFFFTAVPPLEEEKKTVAEEKEEAEPQKVKERRRVTLEATPFAHGPYGARLCDQCHETSSALSFRSFGRKVSERTARPARGTPGMMMVAPSKELCTECHTYKSPQRAFAEGLWLHGPAADGGCTLCHSPHQSENPYMLRRKPGDTCRECHSEGYVVNQVAHSGSTDCLVCHNPHLGKDMLLLKRDYNELF